jgi:Ni/Co efflux regulator RcnB
MKKYLLGLIAILCLAAPVASQAQAHGHHHHHRHHHHRRG